MEPSDRASKQEAEPMAETHPSEGVGSDADKSPTIPHGEVMNTTHVVLKPKTFKTFFCWVFIIIQGDEAVS